MKKPGVSNVLNAIATGSAALGAYGAMASGYSGGALFPAAVGTITTEEALSFPKNIPTKEAIPFIKNGIYKGLLAKGAIAAAGTATGIYDMMHGNPNSLAYMLKSVGIPLGLSTIGDIYSTIKLKKLEKYLSKK